MYAARFRTDAFIDSCNMQSVVDECNGKALKCILAVAIKYVENVDKIDEFPYIANGTVIARTLVDWI